MRASPLSALAVTTILVAALGILVTAPRAQAKEVTFVIEAKLFDFSPTLLIVDPGDNVTIIVFNNETSSPHTFDLDEYGIHLGTQSDPILPGQNRTAIFTASIAGTFYFYCNVVGHATHQGAQWTGMAGRLQVGAAPPPSDPTPIIVGGLVVLGVSLAAIAYAMRRGAGKPRSP